MELRAALHMVGTSAHRLDERLASGADPQSDPALAYRAAKLTSPRFRRELAGELRAAADRAQRPVALSAAAPVGRGALVERHRIEELSRLLEADRPVDARGVAATLLLLTAGSSPLWAGSDPADLAAALDDAILGLGR